MNRKIFLKNVSYLAAGSMITPHLSRFMVRNGEFTPLRNNTGFFTARGGTIGWFAADDAIVAVDSQYEDTAGDFIRGVSEYGSGPEQILFNTHHHGDHVSGNGVFSGAEYRIIAHENVPSLQRAAAETQGNLDSIKTADETFDSEYSLSAGGETITARYYGNAHTAGDSVIWFENANVAHMGDLIFNRVYPFIDRNSGASITGWISTLEAVVSGADRDTLFIFGHGNPSFGVTGNSADILYMRDFLSALLEHTQNEIDAGKSREEITQTEQLEQFPDHVSPGDFLSLPRNLDVAWRELTGHD